MRPPQFVSPRRLAPGGLAAFLLALAALLWPGAAAPVAAVQILGVGDEPAEGQRVVLVTGSTSGLGREVARSLAASGAHVIIHGRSPERAQALLDEIRAGGSGSARYYLADFAVLDQVRSLGEAILRDYTRLDALVNNAGIALIGERERRMSPDGHELHFQVNYLSGYLLTSILLPRLRDSAPATIVNVSSRGQAPPDFDDLNMEEGYSFGRAYGQSKLAQIMFTFELAASLDGSGVTVNALHPSSVMDTEMILSRGLEPQSSVETGRDAVLRLLEDREAGTGRYFNVFEPARAMDAAYDPAVRARLMEASDALTGVDRREWGGS